MASFTVNRRSATVVDQLTDRVDEVKRTRAHNEIAITQILQKFEEDMYEFPARMWRILAGEKDTPAVCEVEHTYTAKKNKKRQPCVECSTLPQ